MDNNDSSSPRPSRSRRRRAGGAEAAMVPEASFRSYYGRPVIAEPVWRDPDVPGYLFLGGLAGASSVLAAGAQAAGYRQLARNAKVAAAGAISLSAVALVHDLGRPSRFVNMLRVFKPTSPMSVGSWLLAGYGPLAGAAAGADVLRLFPRAGAAVTAAAGVLGPLVATYTAVLLCDTAVPAWHEGYREMPYVFAGSAASAAGGLGLLLSGPDQAGPARNLAIAGSAVELAAKRRLITRLGSVPGGSGGSPAPRGPGDGAVNGGDRPGAVNGAGRPGLAGVYEGGRAGSVLRAAEVLTAAGLAGSVLAGTIRGRRGRVVSAVTGAALVAASAMTRWGIFQAGMASARQPGHTIGPQRARLAGAGAAR